MTDLLREGFFYFLPFLFVFRGQSPRRSRAVPLQRDLEGGTTNRWLNPAFRRNKEYEWISGSLTNHGGCGDAFSSTWQICGCTKRENSNCSTAIKINIKWLLTVGSGLIKRPEDSVVQFGLTERALKCRWKTPLSGSSHPNWWLVTTKSESVETTTRNSKWPFLVIIVSF